VKDQNALAMLERRLTTLLPEEYQDSYESLEPVPMRSAGLKYRVDGTVAWDQIWGSFCDLAMAGGPPHKGRLLEPGRVVDIEAQPERYEEVAEEICRGVRMAADLDAEPSPIPGWVRVLGLSHGNNHAMSGWLLRAIVMENVAARSHGKTLDLPAAPHFRLDKEIKNVVTVIAKTCHYWLGHMPGSQQLAIGELFAEMAAESPLLEPAHASDGTRPGDHDRTWVNASEAIRNKSAFPVSKQRYFGWIGVEYPTVKAAIWMMRGLVASNVLARREGTVLFLPVNPISDPNGELVAERLFTVHGLAAAKQLL